MLIENYKFVVVGYIYKYQCERIKMGTVLKIVLTSLFVSIIIAILFALMPSETKGQSGDIVEHAKNDIMNSIIDSTGIKQSVDNELRSYSQKIAETIGMRPEQMNAIIDTLQIPNWQATSLPQNASPQSSYIINRDNFNAKITTYDTPEYVTISTHGQDITMKVPSSAQPYVPYLDYLKYL